MASTSPKLIAGIDIEVVLTFHGPELSIRSAGIFQRAHAGGAHGNDAPPLFFMAVYRFCDGLGNAEAFGMHAVVSNIGDADRQEGTVTHVQRKGHHRDAQRLNGLQERGCEVQSGGRCAPPRHSR